MSNIEDKKLSRTDYFDLREKRLKLVYKILYVVAAIWIAIFISITQSNIKTPEVPIYAFALSASSMVIIQIIKYATMELRCMKITDSLNDELKNQTESRYDNIWTSFSLILQICGIILIFHFMFVEKLSAQIFFCIFFVCMLYFIIISLLKTVKRNFKDTTIKRIDIIGTVIGSVAAYSLVAAACLINVLD